MVNLPDSSVSGRALMFAVGVLPAGFLLFWLLLMAALSGDVFWGGMFFCGLLGFLGLVLSLVDVRDIGQSSFVCGLLLAGLIPVVVFTYRGLGLAPLIAAGPAAISMIYLYRFCKNLVDRTEKPQSTPNSD